MASERFFGQALLESDYVNPNFFYLLAKEDKKALQSCRVHIPPTALFEQGFAKALFTTEYIKGHPSSGEVKRKVGRDVDSEDVFDVMTKGISDERAVCAVLIFAAPRAVELTNVRFMDKEEVRRFLFHEVEKPKCLMQRFVSPKGNNNSVILASWSPLLVLTEGRRSMNSLLDRHVSPNARGLTFEDPTIPTLEVAISESTVKEITQTCARIAEHFDRTERLQLNRVTAFFKVDASNTLTLLYTTSLRFHDQVVGQPPVSLATHVHVADLQKKSLTQRFQGLGSKVKRDTEDALEWMDVALSAADEKNAKMDITIPVTGNMSAMLFEESRRGQSRNGKTNKSNKGGVPEYSPVSPTRREPTTSLNGTLNTTGGGAGGFPNVSSSSRHGSLTSPNTAKEKLGSNAKGGTLYSGASPLSPMGPGKGKMSFLPDASSSSEQHHTKPPASFEGQYLTISQNSPLPQPKQLLKFQHVLPNSVNNMSSQVQLHALGLNEDAIRTEWDNFLTQQLRDIKRIKISQAAASLAGASGAAQQNGAGDGTGTDGDATQGAARDGQQNKAPPPPKLYATFGKQTEANSGSGPATRVLGEEKDPEKLQAASMATLKAAQDKAAQREKETYMEEMRDEVARRALGQTKSSIVGDSDGKGKGKKNDDGSNDDVPQVEMEEDPRFYYMPRETRHLVSMPDGIGTTRSTLLPPVFSVSASYSSGGGSGIAPRAAARGGQKKHSSPASPASPSQTHTASNKTSEKQHGRTATPTTIGSPVKSSKNSSFGANASRGTDASNHSSPASSPTSAMEKNASSTFGGRKGGSPVKGGSSSNARRVNGDGLDNTTVTPLSPLTSTASAAVAGRTASQRSFEESSPNALRRHEARNYVEEALTAYARVPKMYADFDALHDAPEEVAIIKERAKAMCNALCTFVQELHYSIHGAFLNRSIPSTTAYVEIPPELRPVMDAHTLARMLHKLHPTVLPREEYFLYSPQSPLASNALSTKKSVVVAGGAEEEAVLRWREQLLGALRAVSLTDCDFERITTWASLLSPKAAPRNENGSLSSPTDAQSPNLADAVPLDPARDLCLSIPLIDGDTGLKILRGESFSVAEDVSHYVNTNNGIVYHRALQHCYYARIVEIKGAQAAQEERKLQEDEARRAAALEALHSALGTRRDSSIQMQLDAEDLPLRAEGSQRWTPQPTTRGKGVSGASSPLKGSRSNVDLQQEASVAMSAHELPDEQSLMQSKVDDMMCKKCHTCRVCCVCSLVSSPSASPKRTTRK